MNPETGLVKNIVIEDVFSVVLLGGTDEAVNGHC